jgi:hypothetical protein
VSGATHPERVVGEGVKDVLGCHRMCGCEWGGAGWVSVSLIVDAEKDGECGTCSRIIKVNHAGEFGAVNIGAIAIPSSVLLTKKAIFLKYRVRPSFDSEACYSLADSGGTIQQHVGETRFPWSIYVRAVRFPDGILLLRKGAIRWLPDRSLEIGSVDQAMALVRSKLPLRVIA